MIMNDVPWWWMNDIIRWMMYNIDNIIGIDKALNEKFEYTDHHDQA